MREVSREASQVSSLRVAILAALNLADEVLQRRGADPTASEDLEARALRLAKLLEDNIISGSDENPDEGGSRSAEAAGNS